VLDIEIKTKLQMVCVVWYERTKGRQASSLQLKVLEVKGGRDKNWRGYVS
jgi:hypothetical protein